MEQISPIQFKAHFLFEAQQYSRAGQSRSSAHDFPTQDLAHLRLGVPQQYSVTVQSLCDEQDDEQVEAHVPLQQVSPSSQDL